MGQDTLNENAIKTAPGIAYFLGCAALAALFRQVLTAVIGLKGIAFAGPLLVWTGIFEICFAVSAGLSLSDMLVRRIPRGYGGSAGKLIRIAMIFSVFPGLVTGALFFLLRKPLSLFLCGEQVSAMLFLPAAVCVLCESTSGTMHAVLENTGFARLSGILRFAETGAGIALAVLFGILFRKTGANTAVLLRNDDYIYVYGAFGILTGAALSALIFCGIRILLRFLLRARIGEKLRTDPAGERESVKGLRRKYFRRLSGLFLSGACVTLSVWFDYRIFHAAVEDKSEALVAFGSFYGRAFSVVEGLTFLVAIPFIGFMDDCIRKVPPVSPDSPGGGMRRKRQEFGAAMRLFSGIAIPVSLFLASAAESLMTLGAPNGNVTAASSLQAISMIVFLGGLFLMLARLCTAGGRTRILAGSCGIAFLVQTIFCVILSRQENPGVSVVSLPILFFFIIADLMLLFGTSEITLIRNRYVPDLLRVILSAAVPAVAVILLQNFLLPSVGAAGCVIVLVLVYFVLYILLALFMHALDLANCDLVPGGRLIIRLAEALGFH